MEVLGGGERLADQLRADDLAVDLDERTLGLVVEGDLADRRDDEGIHDTGQHGEDDEHADGGRQLTAQHHETPRALMMRSMSLIPTNGAMIPPSP